MSSVRDLNSSKKLQQWVGDDEEDLLIAYSKELRDGVTALMAAQNSLHHLAAPEDREAITKAAALMARLSQDMKAIHREVFG